MKKIYSMHAVTGGCLLPLFSQIFQSRNLLSILLACGLAVAAQASPDYSIYLVGSTLVVSDQKGGNDVLSVSEVAGSIVINVTGRNYDINGDPLTVANFPVSFPIAGLTSITVFTGEGNDVINVGAFVTPLPDFSLNGAQGDDVINFNGSFNLISGASLDVDLQDDTPIIWQVGTDKININAGANIALSGTGEATLRASQNITINAGGSLRTENGDLIVEANLQSTSSVGNFYGVLINGGSIIVTGDGYLTVKGKGGNSASNFQVGVGVLNNGIINGGPIHAVQVQGWGGLGSGARNYGVQVENNAVISSTGAPVTVIGQGNGTAASGGLSHGVLVMNASLIGAGGSGDVAVTGTGAACVGINNSGVTLATNNAQIASSGGNVTVTGLGGGTAASGSNIGLNLIAGGNIFSNGPGNIKVTGTAGLGPQGALIGVNVTTGTAISALGTGTCTVKGTGRESVGTFNHGVADFGTISAASGDVSVTGFAGGIGAASNNNYGVIVQNSGAAVATIKAGGNGKVTVVGNGAYDAVGNSNFGVFVSGNLATIFTNNGDISVTGKGGGSGASGLNTGIVTATLAKINANGSGTIKMLGTGGNGSGNVNPGVSVETGSIILTSAGNITVTGQGGGSGTATSNMGVQVASTDGNISTIQSGPGGLITIRGTGGNTTGVDNYGVSVGSNGKVLSNNGSSDIAGIGGGFGPASFGVGTALRFNGQVLATGTGTITIKGTGGNGTGGSNFGVLFAGNSLTDSDLGAITVTGIEGNGTTSTGIAMQGAAVVSADANITFISNSIAIATTASITNNNTNTVTIRQNTNGIAINLGETQDPAGGPLNLSDAELDRVTTGNLVIGNTNSGTITVTQPITRPASTNVFLITGGSIQINASAINTAGGNLKFQAAQGVFPTVAGNDVQVGTVSFNTGTSLNIIINGQLVDINYTQLNVIGVVNLTGAILNISGSYIQPQCTPVMIINNDGVDPVIGTFQGLPEGFLFVNYLGSGKNVSISYKGGDGNDVVLIERVIPIVMCPANIVASNDLGECGKDLAFLGTLMVIENCASTQTNDAPAFFDIGLTKVTWVVTDENNNTASCVQMVTIKDIEYPTFVCPGNIETLNQPDADCGAVVDFDLQPTDNCPGFFVDQSHFSGETFGMGITYVDASITDASGNTNYCHFKITVNPRAEICNGIDDDCDGYTDELQDWAFNTKIFASDAEKGNRLGENVDLKGNWAIAGSKKINALGEQVGTAYILYHDDNTGQWSQVAELAPDNSSTGDLFFGYKVAMGNGFCAVSAPFDDQNGVDAGAVYIFKLNSGNPADWVFYQKILGPTAGEQLGSSLDYDNERLLIGASQNNDSNPEAGAAYLFAQAPVGTGNWNLVKKLGAGDPDLGDHFGYDVAISGDYAIVTANSDDEKGINAGAAYVFQKNLGGANNWGQLKKITAVDGQDDDNFGVSVDLDGGWAVLGANKDDDHGSESGSAYVFYQNLGGVVNSWGKYTKLTDYNGAKGEHFGYAVSIDGEHIAIGSRWKRIFASRAGAVFVYHREDTGWVQFSQLNDPTNAYNDNLGSSVAINGQFLMAGIPGDDQPLKADCGAIMVFNGVCGDGHRPQSEVADRTDGLGELAVRCFPIPFDQTLTVEVQTPQLENVQVQIFDLMSREVSLLFNSQMEGTQTMHWEAGELPAGQYILRVSTAEKTVSQAITRVK